MYTYIREVIIYYTRECIILENHSYVVMPQKEWRLFLQCRLSHKALLMINCSPKVSTHHKQQDLVTATHFLWVRNLQRDRT